jgi:glycosyltransferase involved in cell wall biosynthesis
MPVATVAIILSNYNHGRYLPESLGDICGQTRPADQIIVIDDGSTDGSAAIIEEVAARDGRITFLRNGRNLGLQESIARALPLVTTDYLVWAASDDRLLPEFLQKSMPPLERHPEAGLCFSDLSVLQGDTGEVVRMAATPGVGHIFDLRDLPEHLTPATIRQRMKRAYLPIAGNSVVVRRKALLAVGGYPPELDWRSDWFAYTVIALRFGACVVPEALALRRHNSDSYSHRGMRDSVRQAATMGALFDLLAQPRYRDVRRAFRRCPSNFSPLRSPMLSGQLRRLRDGDLLLAYLIWVTGEYKREQRLTVASLLAKLGIRFLRAVRARFRRLLVALARRLREALRSLRWGRRAMRLIYHALLKYREQRYTRKMNVVASVRGAVTQEVVRNMVAWQLAIPRTATLGIHGHLCIEGNPDQVQLDRLFSLLCMSGTFESFNIFFDEQVAARELARIFKKPEPSPEGVRFDLCEPHALALGPMETAGLQRAFLPLLDGRRTVTNYLKVAHPRAFVVALGLSEEDDGFADEALGKWLPHLQRFRREAPGVAFCLLNRTMLSQDHAERAPADISPVRSLGFGLSDAVALAQIADAFIGRLDAFGLAAIGAHRPGVYIDPASGDRPNADAAVWFVADASPEQCLDILRVVLRERRLGGRRAPTNPPVAGEAGTA